MTNILDLADLPSCQRCKLCQGRTQVVLGQRGTAPTTMVIGEAPGATEDETGSPFQGRSGQLLDEALLAVGVTRDQLYITNAVKCRPAGNKTPSKSDVETCSAWLKLEIAQVQPSKIIVLGATALSSLFPAKKKVKGQPKPETLKITEARGKDDLTFEGIPVFACYHPAAALRDPGKRVPFFGDIARAFGGEVRRAFDEEVMPSNDIRSGPLALDTEFTFSKPHKLVGAAIADDKRSRWFEGYGCVNIPDWIDGRTLLLHNAKADLDEMDEYHLFPPGMDRYTQPFHDTMVMAYLLRRKRLSLKELGESELGLRVTRLEDLTGNKLEVDEVPRDDLARYCRQDTRLTYSLYETLLPQVYAQGLDFVYHQIDLPLIPTLIGMERRGITVDVPYLKQLAVEFEAELADLLASLRLLVGDPGFNPNSNQQVARWLYDKLGLPRLKGDSVDAPTIKELHRRTGSLELTVLLKYREVSKLHSTYILPAIAAAEGDPEGRLHPEFHNCAVETGRLSASDPNTQNIPARTELGRRVRRAFIPRPGWKLVKADQEQAELRILACLGHDEGLLEVFRNGGDPHQDLADLLGVDRRTGKTMQYGIGYGMGAPKLAMSLGIPLGRAQGYLDQFFEVRPGIKRYLDAAEMFLIEHGYSQTIFGRRNYLEDVYSETKWQVNAAFREGDNMPIQGTDADLMRMFMRKMDDKLRQDGYEARLLLQVHDEIVLEAPPEEAEEVKHLIEEEALKLTEPWEDVFPIPIPMEAKILDNWAGT